MSETDLKEKSSAEVEEEKAGSEQTLGLGKCLRSERERQGFTPEQIARMTRMRRHMVDALEDEQWESLPPPVFVKGFIRSYARVLSLDETRILGLYEDSAGAASLDSGPPAATSKRKSRRVLFVLSILCALSVAAYLYWIQTDIHNSTAPMEEKSLQSREKLDTPMFAGQEVDPKPNTHESQGRPAGAPEGQADEIYAPEETFLLEKDQGTVFAVEDPAPDSPTTGDDDDRASYVLQAAVHERTWVRIYVDNEDPQEYIFQPGTNPQWKAEKGFNLIVGNAAGIELDFNGKRVDDLGNEGEVVRLFFPRDFRSDKYED